MVTHRGTLLLGLTSALWLSACAQPSTPPPETASAGSSQRAAAAGGSAGQVPFVPTQSPLRPAAGTWVDAMRDFDWRDAVEKIDALPPAERQSGRARFARAWALSRLGEPAEALPALEGLEQLVPELAAEIAELRRKCRARVGPFAAAAADYVKSGTVDDLISAARLFQKAEQPADARRTIDDAWKKFGLLNKSERTQRLEGSLRRRRAKIALEAADTKTAREDLLWLATRVPADKSAKNADVDLEQLVGKPVLTKQQRFSRAEVFAERGDFVATERELLLAKQAPGPALALGDVVRTRARALYESRTDYVAASALYDEAAKLDVARRVENQFYAARALSRGHRDEDAIQRYKKLADANPKTSYAEEARFLMARLSFILGDYAAAEKHFADYLQRYGRSKGRRNAGRFEERAHYERAIGRLAAKDYAVAVRLLKPVLTQGSASQRVQNRQLHAVALAESGNKAAAVKEFRAIILEHPLSFPALLSAARLRALGEQPPAALERGVEEALAPVVVLLPSKAALLESIGLDLEAEAELYAQESALKDMYAPRGGEALCALYGILSTAHRRYQVGRRIVRQRALDTAPSVNTAWTWDCVYPRPYLTLVQAAEVEFKLPTGVVHAVMRQESAFRPAVVSPAHAVGLMQLIPSTARRAAEELGQEYRPAHLVSPAYNIHLGAFYFAKVLDRFGGQVPLAAASYNAGPHAVSRWLKAGGKLPLDVWAAAIPYAETRSYVGLVVSNWARYQYLQGGDAAVVQLDLKLPEASATEEDY